LLVTLPQIILMALVQVNLDEPEVYNMYSPHGIIVTMAVALIPFRHCPLFTMILSITCEIRLK